MVLPLDEKDAKQHGLTHDVTSGIVGSKLHSFGENS